MPDSSRPGTAAPLEPQRRTFLSKASSVAMATGLVAGYGTLARLAGLFLYPGPRSFAWVFVAETASLKPGDSFAFRIPEGQTVSITRLADQGTAEDFLALSSVCPHLGCQVHWEPQNERFFCPCHNGAFNASGEATEGPPAEAGQSLSSYNLKVEAGLLFVEVPTESLGGSQGESSGGRIGA